MLYVIASGAPNFAAGNPVLAKHASIVPHCASVFEELVNEAGAPRGAWLAAFAHGKALMNPGILMCPCASRSVQRRLASAV